MYCGCAQVLLIRGVKTVGAAGSADAVSEGEAHRPGMFGRAASTCCTAGRCASVERSFWLGTTAKLLSMAPAIAIAM